jgi:hypothetical protein
MMKGRIDSKMLFGFGLLVVILYCIVRTLGALAASPETAVNEAANANPGELELLLHDLKQNITVMSDSVEACSQLRNPLVEGKAPRKQKSSSQTQKRYVKPSTKARLTGLVLDDNPMAIVEIKGISHEVEIGDLLEGKKVIDIDERGVHVLDNKEVVIIR